MTAGELIEYLEDWDPNTPVLVERAYDDAQLVVEELHVSGAVDAKGLYIAIWGVED